MIKQKSVPVFFLYPEELTEKKNKKFKFRTLAFAYLHQISNILETKLKNTIQKMEFLFTRISTTNPVRL